MTQQAPWENQHLVTEPQLASEGGDQAGDRMVAQYGMSRALGPVYYEHDVEHPFLGRRIAEGTASDATTHAIEEETQEVLAQALGRASRIIQDHRHELDCLAHALLERETLEGRELNAALDLPTAA